VITKWQSDSDLCAGSKTAQPSPKPQRKIVSTLKKQPVRRGCCDSFKMDCDLTLPQLCLHS
jgi:hypothetical protein